MTTTNTTNGSETMFKIKTNDGDTHSTHVSLRDAMDQADLIHGTVDFSDVRIEAGEGDGHDTGVIDSIDGTTAVVRWDSLVVSNCDTDDITAVA